MNISERFIPSLSKEREDAKALTVMKLGGASLENADAIAHAVSIVRREYLSGRPLVLVLSAMKNVTDKLDRLCQSDNPSLSDELIAQHYSILTSLQIANENKLQVQKEIDSIFQGLKIDAGVARHYREENHPDMAEYTDRVLSCGERLIVRLFTAALSSNGISALTVESSDIVQTDNKFGQANPDFLTSSEKTKRKISPLIQQNVIPVITGFIGSTIDGKITTLGRNTSDYSASLIGRIIGARQVIFWKDVDGLYDKDPKLNADARFTKKATFNEVAAMETKVIHAKAFEPLYGTGIVVFIKNFKKPEEVGTEISEVIDKRVDASLAYQIAIMHNTGRVPRRLRVFKADSF